MTRGRIQRPGFGSGLTAITGETIAANVWFPANVFDRRWLSRGGGWHRTTPLNRSAPVLTFDHVEQERNEVYERIPWETLEEKKSDRQWVLYGVAGAVVLGALAYSFMSNRPAPIPVANVSVPQVETAVDSTPAPAMSSTPALPPTLAAAPVVTAEADLYAEHPERLIDRVAAHAEWFVAEYLTVDGSEQGRETLSALMPVGVPLPTAPEGTRVFVEWVRASEIVEIAPLTFEATVMARTLAAGGEEVYERQAPLEVTVEVSVSTGAPQVVLPPEVASPIAGPAHDSTIAEVPEEVAAAALELSGGSEVIGGVPSASGGWRVVTLAVGPDGVSRPVTVEVP